VVFSNGHSPFSFPSRQKSSKHSVHPSLKSSHLSNPSTLPLHCAFTHFPQHSLHIGLLLSNCLLIYFSPFFSSPFTQIIIQQDPTDTYTKGNQKEDYVIINVMHHCPLLRLRHGLIKRIRYARLPFNDNLTACKPMHYLPTRFEVT